MLAFLCTLPQFRRLMLCCLSVAHSYILSLLPSSQLNCETECMETFQWFYTVVPKLQSMEKGVCHTLWLPSSLLTWISFPGRDRLPSGDNCGMCTWTGGLEVTFRFTKVKYRGINLSSRVVVYAVWHAVVADDCDSLNCEFLGNITIKYVASHHGLLMKVRQHGGHSAPSERTYIIHSH